VKKLGSTERNTQTVLTPTGLLLEGVSVHPDGLKVISGFRVTYPGYYTQFVPIIGAFCRFRRLR
jgi:hypothetical protein